MPDTMPPDMAREAEERQLGKLYSSCKEDGQYHHVFDHGFMFWRELFGLFRIKREIRRWDEVRTLVFDTARLNKSLAGDSPQPQLAVIVRLGFADGSTFQSKRWRWGIHHDTPCYRFIAERIAEAQGPSIWEEIQTGRDVPFGKAVANLQGLRHEDRFFPWDQIQEISFLLKELDVTGWARTLYLTVVPSGQDAAGARAERLVELPATDVANIEALRRLHARIEAG